MSLKMKRKRIDLSLSRQVDALEELDKNISQTKVAKDFGISPAQVSRLSRNKFKILSEWERNENPDRKRRRMGKNEDVAIALKTWATEVKGKHISLSRTLLKEKAKELAETLNKPDFVPTNGWISRWKDKYSIGGGIAKSRKKDKDSESVLPHRPTGDLKEEISKLISQHRPDDVYTTSEIGIYFQAIPEGTSSFKNENSEDEKARITVLITCNMSGTDKRRLLVIGKSKNPSVDGVTGIPVDYVENSTALMTPAIFRQWCCDLDRQMKQQKRNIILIVNRCSAHPPDIQLTNVKLFFLLLNSETPDLTLTHPCEKGIHQIFKSLYRKQIIHRIVAEIGEGISKNKFVKDISLLDAMHMLQKSWIELQKEIIVNCFANSGFQVTHLNGGIKKNTEHKVTAPAEIGQSEFDNYVDIDKNVQCFGIHTENEIYAEGLKVKLPKKPESVESNKVETKETVTSAAALRALMTVRQYLEGHGVDNFNAFYCLETNLYSTIHKASAHKTKK